MHVCMLKKDELFISQVKWRVNCGGNSDATQRNNWISVTKQTTKITEQCFRFQGKFAKAYEQNLYIKKYVFNIQAKHICANPRGLSRTRSLLNTDQISSSQTPIRTRDRVNWAVVWLIFSAWFDNLDESVSYIVLDVHFKKFVFSVCKNPLLKISQS